MNRTGLVLSFIFISVLFSCSKENPLTPSIAPEPITQSNENSPNRLVWGAWKFTVDPENMEINAVPMRNAEFHLNAVKLLEKAPCSDCLTIGNFDFKTPGQIKLDVTIRHPFKDNLNLTAFDVRGVMVTDSNYPYKIFGMYKISWGEGIPRMLNADGYTNLFNPSDFPESGPESPIFKYYTGSMANSNDLSAVLNPYIAYGKDNPRRYFLPGTEETRTIILQSPGGYFEFGYIVDVCWEKVGFPVTDPVNDFPLTANCPEAYQISVTIDGNLDPNPYHQVPIYIEVFNHQGVGPSMGSYIQFEAWDLLFGLSHFDFSKYTGDDSAIYTGHIINKKGVSPGEYPGVIRILFDHSFQIIPIKINEMVPYPPIAKATAYPEKAPVNTPVDFDGSGSLDPDGGSIVKWEWDWNNDGVFDDTGETITHSFDTIGTIPVQLRVTDDEGESATLEEPLSIEIKAGPGWARTWGCHDLSDRTYSVGVDSTGNAYVTGSLRCDLDFDPGPNEVIGYTWPCVYCLQDGYICKYDTNGNLIWVRTMGGDGGTAPFEIAIDKSDNIYVVGANNGDVAFEGDPSGKEYEAAGAGMFACFLCVYDTDGNFKMARMWGGMGHDQAIGVDADSLGNIYIGGYFTGPADLDPGPDEHIFESLSGPDIFLLKLNQNGEYIWAKTWGGDISKPDPDDILFGIAVADNDQIYATGTITGDADFDPGPGEFILSSDTNGNAFLTSFTTGGDFLWASVWGAEEKDIGYSVTTDEYGSAYVSGTFQKTVDFDPGPGEDIITAPNNGIAYLTKYDSLGNYQWVRTWGGGMGDTGLTASYGGNSDLYIAGFFGNGYPPEPEDFDPGPGVWELTSNCASDVFVTSFDLSGNFRWAASWGGCPDSGIGDEEGFAAASNLGFVYVAGCFIGETDFDPGPGYDLHDFGYNFFADFLTKFSSDGEW
ncbi:MAG: PKD domain-containing protein [bacterium]